MRSKKCIAVLLALTTVLLLALASCGSSADPAKTGGNEQPGSTPAPVDPTEQFDLPKHDLQGHDFVFLVHDVSASHLKLNEIYSDALTGDKVNDAVFSRNAQIQQEYNCTISQEMSASPATAAREVLSAGEYVYDFIFSRTIDLRSLSGNGLLVDLFTLDNLQLDKAWYSKGFMQGLQIGGHLFYVVGDASTKDERAASVVFVNRDLIEKNELEDPYDLVDAGKWTVQKMYELSEACAVDSNGDGVWTIGDDVFAYMCGSASDYYHVAAGGLYICNITAPGEFTLPATLKKEIISAWDTLRPLLTSNKRDVSAAGSRFRNGYAAFYDVNLGAILNFGQTAIGYGLLPLPKINEEQEKYYTTVGSLIDGSFGIPVTTMQLAEAEAAGFENGAEMCAYFFNVFSYYSRQTLTPAFFEDVVKKQMVHDETSARMLELAIENKIYDPVCFFNFGSITNIFSLAGSPGADTTGSDINYDKLTSLYDERYLSARTALNKYLAVLDVMDNP